MRRLGAAAFALACLFPASVFAAEVTRIASSFEENDPFGMFLDVGFAYTRDVAKITREHHQDATVLDVAELIYTGNDTRLTGDLHIGLWQDVEFHFGLPIVLSQSRTRRFAAGTDESNSTIVHNCLNPDGTLIDPNCPNTRANEQPMFNMTPAKAGDPPGTSFDSNRGGIGDMTFGLAYAIFNQRKDETKPMWIVGIDYTAPTAALLDPTLDPLDTSNPARRNFGDRFHKYKFFTAFSRRMGVADPYVQFHYTVPFRGPKWYSNCDHPSRSMGRPGNCNTPDWTRSETGIRIPHVAGMQAGTEFNLWDDAAKASKFAIDFRGIATYVSEGRYFNPLSDAFGKMLYTEEYMSMGGQVGLVAYLADYLQLKGNVSLVYNTDHLLTNEPIGKDVDGSGNVDVDTNPAEINPNFDWRADMVSRRFRATENTIFHVDVSLTFNF
jgi:hypothetical protein